MLPACKLGKMKMEKIDTTRSKLIVIKDYQNAGKTTTMWLVFLELVRLGAEVKLFSDKFDGESKDVPAVLPPSRKRYDFVAELYWDSMRVVIISHGDYFSFVNRELQKILPSKPDFVICAANVKHWGKYTWDSFKKTYTNLDYERVCFWSEKSADKKDEELVKRPTIEAIIKYMKP